MSIIQNIMALFGRQYSLKDPEAAALMGVGFDRIEGIPAVSPEGAMTISAYFAAARTISEDLAGLPLRVYREGETREYLRTHPVKELMEQAEHYGMTPRAFREYMQFCALTYGNAYAVILREGSRATELIPVHPTMVMVHRDAQFGLWYEVAGNRYLPDEVLHVRGIGDDLEGWSVARLAANTLGLTRQGETSQANSSAAAGQPAGVLSVPPATNQATREALGRAWKKLAKDRGVGVLDDLSKFEPISSSMSATDAQLLESRRFSIEELCRWFRIPPSKIGVPGTGASYDQANREYAQSALAPWCARWEQELSRKLMSSAERRNTFLAFDLKALLLGDHAARSAYYRTLFSIGAITPNEIRSLEDMPLLEDPRADSIYMPLNLSGTGDPSPDPDTDHGRPPAEETEGNEQ